MKMKPPTKESPRCNSAEYKRLYGSDVLKRISVSEDTRVIGLKLQVQLDKLKEKIKAHIKELEPDEEVEKGKWATWAFEAVGSLEAQGVIDLYAENLWLLQGIQDGLDILKAKSIQDTTLRELQQVLQTHAEDLLRRMFVTY